MRDDFTFHVLRPTSRRVRRSSVCARRHISDERHYGESYRDHEGRGGAGGERARQRPSRTSGAYATGIYGRRWASRVCVGSQKCSDVVL
jgi:hypothetical protein